MYKDTVRRTLSLSWRDMRKRCNNPANNSYARYGGRGIKVCKEWDSFEQFVADMGPRPEGCTLDRIDNDGDYSPGNCRWATKIQQQRNTSRTRLITYNNETRCIADWAKVIGVDPSALFHRVKKHGIENVLRPEDFTGKQS